MSMLTKRVRSLLILTALGGMGSGCAAARQTYLTPNYQTRDRTHVIRLEVVTAPADPSEGIDTALVTSAVLDMWGVMAQRYLNDHRDFLVVHRQALSSSSPELTRTADPRTQASRLAQSGCKERIQGRLVLIGQVMRRGDEAQIQMWTELRRCSQPTKITNPNLQSQRIWSAEVDHISASADSVLVTLRRQYVKRFGASVSDFAAPSFLAIKKLFELTPRPKLTRDEDVIEKIELEY